MFDTGGEEEELDVLEPGKSKGVDDLDRVVVDHLGICVIQLQNLKIYLLSLLSNMKLPFAYVILSEN